VFFNSHETWKVEPLLTDGEALCVVLLMAHCTGYATVGHICDQQWRNQSRDTVYIYRIT